MAEESEYKWQNEVQAECEALEISGDGEKARYLKIECETMNSHEATLQSYVVKGAFFVISMYVMIKTKKVTTALLYAKFT